MCKLSTQNFLRWVTVGGEALAGLTILLSALNHAHAQVPANCNGDATFATLGRAVGQSQFITNGSTVSVVASIANQTGFGGTTGCDASNIVAFLVCPNASGTLPGGGTNDLTSGTSLLFGPVTSPFSLQANPPDSIQFPTFSCTINVSPGVHTAQIGIFAEGFLEDNVQSPNDPQSASKTISFNVFRPNICVTKECVNTCTPFGQPIQFSGTVTNCGDEPLIHVKVTDNPAATLSFTSNGVPVSGTGPFALAVGGALAFTGQYTPSGSGAALCGPFTDTITATGAGALTGAGVTNTASATCQVCNNPCVAVTKNCGAASISLGQSYTVSGLVTNCGNVPLTNVVVTDTITDATGGVTTVTINISGTLGTGGTAAVPTQTITPTLCGPSTDQFTMTAEDLCHGAPVAPASSATCVTEVICLPCIGVSKLIACGPCGANPAGLNYGPTATGVAGTNNPAFCYQIVVTNCGSITLTNVQISDPTLGLTFTLPTNLAPGTATAPFFTGISWPVGDHTNVVTVAGQSQATGASVSATSSAIAIVVPISVSCTLSVSNQFNLDNPIVSGHVTLPSNAPVEVQLSIDNPSADDLDVSISPLTLFDCISGTRITLPPSVFIVAGGSSNFVGCLPVNCPGGTNISVTVQGTAVASKLISCVLDSRGSNIMSAASSCMAQVVCTQGCVCANPALGLGAAGGTTVLELDAASVSITGPAGGVLGNISIGPGGKLSITGSEFITGKVILAPGATFSDSSSGSIGGIEMNVDLSAEINAAYAAATADANLRCTQQFATLDGKTVTKIVGGSGLNVICVGNVVLSGTQILLTGPSDALFIFNVTNKFVLTGGGAGPQIRVDQSAGLKPSAVLYNILGSGPDVAFSGGGGGVNCCAAIVDGTILAPFRKIALSPGLVNGEIISSKDISIVSGASVRCPCPPSTKAIVNGSNPVLNTQEN